MVQSFSFLNLTPEGVLEWCWVCTQPCRTPVWGGGVGFKSASPHQEAPLEGEKRDPSPDRPPSSGTSEQRKWFSA